MLWRVARTVRDRIETAFFFAQIADEVFDGEDLISIAPEQVRFRHCSFRGAQLRDAKLDGCYFWRCDLSGADLSGASLRSATFTACNLRAADLRRADLTEAELTYLANGADGGRTDLTGALLDGADLTDVTAERVIGWPED